MHPEQFDGLVGRLKRDFDIVTLDELEADPNRPQAVLSFDDGYYDFVEYAAPIMEKHGVKCNLNIVPHCIESGRPPWNVRLYDFLEWAPKEAIGSLDLPGFDRELRSSRPRDKMTWAAALSQFLKNCSHRERRPLWERIEEWMESYGGRPEWTPMLSIEEVREVRDYHQIGVHSYSHDSMGYESNDYFRDDVTKCFEYFDGHLGVRPDIYAFPNGSYRQPQIRYLMQKGVSYILLVEEKFAEGRSGILPRITVGGASTEEVWLRSLGIRARGTL